MFEVNGTYENRNGIYTVVSMSGNKMTVRYQDGSEKTLNMGIQERIWENIVAEREAKKQRHTKSSGPIVNCYINTLSIPEDSDLMIPGLKQRVAASHTNTNLLVGDRLIYYAIEPKLFFAVATTTTKPRKVKAKDYLFGTNPKADIFLYPIDVDAHIIQAKLAIPADSIELESLANHSSVLIEPDKLHSISEDDFELLAELIAENDAEDDADDEDEDEDAPIIEDVEDLVDLS